MNLHKKGSSQQQVSSPHAVSADLRQRIHSNSVLLELNAACASPMRSTTVCVSPVLPTIAVNPVCRVDQPHLSFRPTRDMAIWLRRWMVGRLDRFIPRRTRLQQALYV